MNVFARFYDWFVNGPPKDPTPLPRRMPQMYRVEEERGVFYAQTSFDGGETWNYYSTIYDMETRASSADEFRSLGEAKAFLAKKKEHDEKGVVYHEA